MSKLLLALLLIISPHFGDDDLPEEIDLPDDVEEDVVDDVVEDEDIEEVEEEEVAPKQMSRGQKEIITLRERAQRAEDASAKLQRDLDDVRKPQQQVSNQPSEDQRTWQQEEEILKSPDATDWQRYAVQSARSAREAQTNSRNALNQAADLADRAKFDKYSATKPKLYNMYKDKVETLLIEFRGRGANPPREELLALAIGRDMRDGVLKSSSKTTKEPVPRGATPRARSDVNTSGSGRLTEAEARAKRLENVRI